MQATISQIGKAASQGKLNSTHWPANQIASQGQHGKVIQWVASFEEKFKAMNKNNTQKPVESYQRPDNKETLKVTRIAQTVE